MVIPGQFELARVTIELESPATIGGGEGSDLIDSVCVTDANGLPALPGTSIAGVLRHAFAECHRAGGAAVLERIVFGYQDRKEGQASRLWISWGAAHDAFNRPVSMRCRQVARNDPVLAALRTGIVRDHVRLDERGVPDERGKFDAGLVPAGARFSFWSLLDRSPEGPGGHALPPEDLPSLQDLIGLLADPVVRLGAAGRRGYGAFRVRDVLYRRFDLTRDEDWRAFSGVELAPDAPPPGGVFQRLDPERLPRARSDVVRARIVLEPEDYVLFGTGEPVEGWREHLHPDRRNDKPSSGKDPSIDRIGYTEPRIAWSEDGRGFVTEEPEYVLPASSIKGALRHRVAFHHRALTGRWVDAAIAAGEALGPDEDEAVTALFGSIKDRNAEGDPGGDGRGRRGRVLFGETRISRRTMTVGVLDHVSLDRFTQGPMDGMLFSEAPLFGRHGPEAIPIEVEMIVSEAQRIDATARQALRRALDDLVEGRLALGAGSNRGHGYFRGRIEWDASGEHWLREALQREGAHQGGEIGS